MFTTIKVRFFLILSIPSPPLAPLRGGEGNAMLFCVISARCDSKCMTEASLRALACILNEESATLVIQYFTYSLFVLEYLIEYLMMNCVYFIKK